jgi:hypothetical protein
MKKEISQEVAYELLEACQLLVSAFDDEGKLEVGGMDWIRDALKLSQQAIHN